MSQIVEPQTDLQVANPSPVSAAAPDAPAPDAPARDAPARDAPALAFAGSGEHGMIFPVADMTEAVPSADGVGAGADIYAFLNGVAEESMAYATKIAVPDVSVTASGVDIKIKDMSIRKFAPPSIKYRFVPPNKFIASFKVPSIVFGGSFHATRPTLITTQKDSGTVEFTSANVSIDLSATIGEFDNGIPRVVNIASCKVILGPLNMTMRNTKASFAIDAMHFAAATVVRPLFDSKVFSQLLSNPRHTFANPAPPAALLAGAADSPEPTLPE